MELAQNSRPSLPQKSDPNRKLTASEFQHLADVPPEAEWFANLDNPRTRRAYGIDIREFMAFAGIVEAQEFRQVTRAHVIAWRKYGFEPRSGRVFRRSTRSYAPRITPTSTVGRRITLSLFYYESVLRDRDGGNGRG